MSMVCAPRRRPALSVLARALVAGTVLGASVSTALAFSQLLDVGVLVVLPGIVDETLVGTGTALISALGWLLVVGRGPRWAAELVAALLAAAPFALLWLVSQATVVIVFAVAVGIVAAFLARWQGYQRPRRRIRPTSSGRAG